MMQYEIDRFEGAVAVCLKDGFELTINRADLPIGVKEGDILIAAADGYIVDENETAARRERSKSLLDDIFKKT